MNIYGKNVVKETSKITFDTNKVILYQGVVILKMTIAINFKDGKKFDKEITTAAVH